MDFIQVTSYPKDDYSDLHLKRATNYCGFATKYDWIKRNTTKAWSNKHTTDAYTDTYLVVM